MRFKINTVKETGLRATAAALIIFLVILPGCHEKKSKEENNGLKIIWEVVFPFPIYYSSAALSPDEHTVYIGTSTWGSDSHAGSHLFVALNAATGSERWRILLGTGEVRSTPAVAPDSTVYFAVEMHDSLGAFIGDRLWHVSSGGDSLWTFDINPSGYTSQVGQSSPAIGADGTVYIAGDHLYAINPGGSLRWSALNPMQEMMRNAPVIGSDGTVYFVFHNIPLTALNPADGSVLWSCPLGVNDHCFASPAIGADGTLYENQQPGLLYAISKTGQIQWTFDIASAGFTGTFRSSPAIGGDGVIYFGLNYGSPSSALFAVRADGTLKWVFEPADLPDDVPGDHFDIYSSPALASDGNVYFGQEFGRVYGLDTASGAMVSLTETRSGITWPSPAIDRAGRLFIGDLSGHFFAIQTPARGLDSATAWPKFRYDNSNAGRFILKYK